MKYKLLIGGIAAVLVSGISLLADDHDKQTIITVNETVRVPGKTLPPGKYVMQLLSSQSNRNIVEIFNEDKSQLQALIMAIPNRRVERVDKTILRYWETPGGQPPALRAWFFPDDFVGQEFVYPKDEALQISKNNNNANVPNYEGNEALTADNAPRLTVHSDDTTVAVDTTPTTPAPQVAAAPAPSPAPLETATVPPPQENTLVAQNTPTPSPLQDATPSSTAINSSSTPTTPDIDELPRTASPIPAIAFAGLALVTLAGLSRLLRS